MKTKVILITGTNSGFGWLAANSCAVLGHKVYATMRDTKGRNAEKAKALAGRLISKYWMLTLPMESR